MKKSIKRLLVVSTLLVTTGLVTGCQEGSGSNIETTSVSQHTPQMLSGEGAPSNDLGEDGDFYTDTITGAEYEKKNGEWVLTKKGDTVYTVTFNLNGGQFPNGDTTYPDQTVREGHWVTAPVVDPVKDHCTFNGWFANGSTTAWQFTGQGVYGDVDLVANWTVNEEDKITVTVNPNNGEATYTYETFVGDYYYPSIPTKSGYDFQGWYVESTGEQYTGYVTADLADDVLIAKWEKASLGVEYQVEANGEVSIIGILNIEAVSVTVPNVINGRKVTTIKKTAFSSRIYLVNIYLPENIKTIEDGAFAGTYKLANISVDSNNLYFTSVNGVLYNKSMTKLILYPTKAGESFTVPATVKEIGAYAFYYSLDMGISSVIFSEGLEEIGAYAFAFNETISSYQFPSTLKKIGKCAFFGSTYSDDDDSYSSPQGIITDNTLNEGLEEIGYMAFANQYFSDTFELPSTVKIIGDYAFANCTAIVDLVLDKSLESFGYNAFAGCTGILELHIDSANPNFTVVDDVLYTKDMKKLVMCPSGRTEAISIPEGVTELGDCAFYMVDRLTDYTFPSTLTKIGDECFAQTYELDSFTIPDTVTEIGEECFYCSGISSITIGTGISVIPEAAFCETSLTSVNIPGNVKTIEYGAFELTTSLSSVTFGEGVEEIGKYAFYKCNISTFDMPNSLTTLCEGAFNGNNITALNIKDNLTTLGSYAFMSEDDGTTIETITVTSGNAKFVAKDNLLMSKDYKTLYMASKAAGVTGSEGGTKTVTVTIPEGIEEIGEYAFAYCKDITNISFPTSLKKIGMAAFMNTKFKTASFGSNLKEIGEAAFYFTYLTTVTFSEGLEVIGDYAFNLSDITAVEIPNSVKTIGDEAFCRCMCLKSVKLGTGIETIGEFAFADNKVESIITIPASCTSIGKGAFSSTVSTYGAKIKSFVVTDGNTNYATDGTFLMNKDKTVIYAMAGAMTTVTIPSTVNEIADYGMSCCQSAIKSLTIPTSVTKIGYAGLACLMSISSITIPSTVSYIGAYAFAYWKSNQAINFSCSKDYAATNFQKGYLYSCSATVTYVG